MTRVLARWIRELRNEREMELSSAIGEEFGKGVADLGFDAKMKLSDLMEGGVVVLDGGVRRLEGKLCHLTNFWGKETESLAVAVIKVEWLRRCGHPGDAAQAELEAGHPPGIQTIAASLLTVSRDPREIR